MDMLLFVAVAIIAGFIGGKLVQQIKLPAVVGYLLAGLVLGPSFLNIFNFDLLEHLDVFTSFALSLVAFIIGSEMKLSSLREMGTGIGIVTVLESFGAFAVVTIGVYLLTGKLYLALVFGAMAPASAPAGTVAVLHECKAKGRLTNALYAVVGLDDGLAIVIFAVAVALGKLLLTGGTISVAAILEGPILEIAGSVALGAVMGAITGYCTQKLSSESSILALSLGAVSLCAGIANHLHLSLILANLSLGIVFVSLFSAANRKAYEAIEFVSLPVYIIFFFLAGAHLQISLLPAMGLVGLVYLVCRTVGLIGGSFLGATLARQSTIIRNYLGLGILSQAGVAIGLAVLAAAEFRPLGDAGAALAVVVVNTIAATTILFEIIGPIGAKFAISKAGEIGANITEEDLIQTYHVSDVMEADIPIIGAGTPLAEVVRVVSNTESFYYPIVDNNHNLIGAITLNGIRKTFNTQEVNDWLVALDIMEPVDVKTTADAPLSEALEELKHLNAEYMPVVATAQSRKLVGILDTRTVRHRLTAEVLSRQQKADSMHRAQ
jgi:NhaP-type Na+/H+ or K+/H+ antiporter